MVGQAVRLIRHVHRHPARAAARLLRRGSIGGGGAATIAGRNISGSGTMGGGRAQRFDGRSQISNLWHRLLFYKTEPRDKTFSSLFRMISTIE